MKIEKNMIVNHCEVSQVSCKVEFNLCSDAFPHSPAAMTHHEIYKLIDTATESWLDENYVRHNPNYVCHIKQGIMEFVILLKMNL